MNVLALSCSPRKGGNTDLLLDELLRGVGDAWIRSGQAAADNILEKTCLAQLNILPCTQCDHCTKHGCCPLDDDMQQLYPKLLAADWLILASPIYFMAHCAQAKLLIDRCQVFWARRHILKQSLRQPDRPIRRGIFISVGATHGAKVFAGAKITMKWFFDALEMVYWDNLIFEGLDRKGAVREHPAALQRAYLLGGKLAQMDQ